MRPTDQRQLDQYLRNAKAHGWAVWLVGDRLVRVPRGTKLEDSPTLCRCGAVKRVRRVTCGRCDGRAAS